MLFLTYFATLIIKPQCACCEAYSVCASVTLTSSSFIFKAKARHLLKVFDSCISLKCLCSKVMMRKPLSLSCLCQPLMAMGPVWKFAKHNVTEFSQSYFCGDSWPNLCLSLSCGHVTCTCRVVYVDVGGQHAIVNHDACSGCTSTALRFMHLCAFI